MLTGSTLLRVLLTIVVAGLLAALWQALPPLTGRSSPPPATPPVRRAEPARPPSEARTAEPTIAAPPPVPATQPPAAPQPIVPAPAPPAPPDLPPPASEGPAGLRAGTPAAADTRPVAVDLVDLNTASVQDLNRLRGGGLIGRSVVRGRPYAAVSDLLTKRVVSRSVYERIRDQVTVR